nr:hypothetical protein [Candidatus Sigynarchaeota archaeon]
MESHPKMTAWSILAIISLTTVLVIVVIPGIIFFYDYPEVGWWDVIMLLCGIEMIPLILLVVEDSYAKDAKFKAIWWRGSRPPIATYKNIGSDHVYFATRKVRQLKLVGILAMLVIGTSSIGLAATISETAFGEGQAFLVNHQAVNPAPAHQMLNYTFPDMNGTDLRVVVRGYAEAPCGQVAEITFSVTVFQGNSVFYSEALHNTASQNCNMFMPSASTVSATSIIQGFNSAEMHNISIELDMHTLVVNTVENYTITVYDMTPLTRVYLNRDSMKFHFGFPLGACIAMGVMGVLTSIKKELLEMGEREQQDKASSWEARRKEKVLTTLNQWKTERGINER